MEAILHRLGRRDLLRMPAGARRLGHALPLGGLALLLALSLFLRPTFVGGNLGYVIVAGQSMEPLLRQGDVVLTWRSGEYHRGDVIAFHVPEGPGAGTVVIHRIVGGSAAAGYLVKGDNKEGVDPWRPRPDDVIGKMALRLPRVELSIIFLRSPLGLAVLAALVTFFLIAGTPGGKDGRER